MSIKYWLLRKLAQHCDSYAVIESEGLFGDFFGFTGMPNSSFTIVSAYSKKNAVRRYCKRYYLKHNHYPEQYNSGGLLHTVPKRFGRYCVIEKSTKKQTFYNQ